MARMLAHFTITPAADGFELRIEDDGGDTMELLATYDQLDLVAEEINRQLDALSDEADEIAPEETDDSEEDE
jgi:hypothetical protein